MANRNLNCSDCGDTRWVAQTKFRELVGEFGTPKKAKNNFQCNKCRALKKKDPFMFQLKYGKHVKNIQAELKSALKPFYKTECLETLKKEFSAIYTKNNIDESKVVYHYTSVGSQRIEGLTIREFPFVGDFYIHLFRQRKFDKSSTKHYDINKKNKRPNL